MPHTRTKIRGKWTEREVYKPVKVVRMARTVEVTRLVEGPGAVEVAERVRVGAGERLCVPKADIFEISYRQSSVLTP